MKKNDLQSQLQALVSSMSGRTGQGLTNHGKPGTSEFRSLGSVVVKIASTIVIDKLDESAILTYMLRAPS